MVRAAQLNIRSDYARERVDELVKRTGMNVTEVIEDALRGYHPPAPDPVPAGFMRKGRVLVRLPRGGPTITLEQTNTSIDEDRNRDPFGG